MITKEQKFRLGVFLTLSILLTVVIAGIFILPKLQNEGDLYHIDFRDMSVNGVNQGADVKYQGVTIGKVIRIDVNPDDLRSVLIYIKIKLGFPVKKDMRATLQYAGITGLRFVEISGGTPESEDLEPGGKIPPAKGLGEKAEDIVLNVDSVVGAVNNLLNPENREKISLFIKNMEKSTSVIARLLEQKEGNLGKSLENLDELLVKLNRVTTKLEKFTDYMNDMSGRFQGEKFERLLTSTETLVNNISKRFSDQEMGTLVRSFDTFTKTATVSLRKIETQFQDMEGEFSRTLVSLRESLDNISRFSRQLTEDPTMLFRRQAPKRKRRK